MISKDGMQASKAQMSFCCEDEKFRNDCQSLKAEAVAMNTSRKVQECIVPVTHRNVSNCHARDSGFEMERWAFVI